MHVKIQSTQGQALIEGEYDSIRDAIEYAVSRQIDLGDILLDDCDLSAANLEKAQMMMASINNSDLSRVVLTDANLGDAKIDNTNLSEAKLDRVYLSDCSALTQCNLSGSMLAGAKLDGMTFTDCNLTGADLSGTDLRRTIFTNSQLFEADLAGADLRGAEGYIFDSTFIKGARMSARSMDPWSLLRREYTGFSLVLNIIVLALFLIPYIAKVGIWSSIYHLERRVAAALTRAGVNLSETSNDTTAVSARLPLGGDTFHVEYDGKWKAYPAWQLVLGYDRGLSYALFAALLITFNIIRFVITAIVAPLKDEEDVSGYTPAYRWRPPSKSLDPQAASLIKHLIRTVESYFNCYLWVYRLHQVKKVLSIFAAIAFIIHGYHWLFAVVWLPGT